MRISDWSSDECSSDLGGGHDTNARALSKVMEKHAGQSTVIINQPAGGGVVAYNEMINSKPNGLTLGQDRKSVGEGKSVYVRVDIGGRRHVKTKKQDR